MIDFNKPDKPKPEEDELEMKKIGILYLCDGEQCPNCCGANCEHTTDIKHAKNFKNIGGVYVEQESGGDTFITNYYYGGHENYSVEEAK